MYLNILYLQNNWYAQLNTTRNEVSYELIDTKLATLTKLLIYLLN